ncbi:GNAT family N-acetyltransferase [bacterium]|nr:GNAT family N-acetyltransferase [bacterium]
MKELDIIPFEPDHVLLLGDRKEETEMRHHEDFMKWAKENHTPGTSYSGFYEGKLLGCAGVRIMWKGVGEAWAMFAPEIIMYGKEAYVYVGEYLKKIMDDNNLHRVQGHVDSEFILAIKYIENLGFKIEGKMRKFGPTGNDHYLYALVRD